MNPTFELRQLQAFVTVVEEGQMTRAAATLHVAQPALSSTIAKLERNVGLRLLDRHSRGIRVTPAGAAFYEKARATLQAAEEARAIVGPWLRAPEAIRVGYMASLQAIARPLLRAFLGENPDADLKVAHLGFASRLRDLRLGSIDAELVFPRSGTEGMRVERLATVGRSVLVPDGHPLAGRSSVEFDELADERFPARHPSFRDDWVDEVWLTSRRSRNSPVTRETPETLDEVWALVYAGKAVAVLPDFMVPPTAGDGVCAIPLVDGSPLEVVLAARYEDERPLVSALFASVAGVESAAPVTTPRAMSAASSGARTATG
jgi:DNA-binding transcriptional LysR family regulator